MSLKVAHQWGATCRERTKLKRLALVGCAFEKELTLMIHASLALIWMILFSFQAEKHSLNSLTGLLTNLLAALSKYRDSLSAFLSAVY